MARIQMLQREDLAADDKDLIGETAINLHRLLAHTPRGSRAMGTIAGHIRRVSTLDPRLRELAILEVARVTGSQYAFSHHVRLAWEAGATDAELDALLGRNG